MLKNIKRFIAAGMVLALMLSLCACHKKDETALTVDGVNFTSAFYSCALLAADSEARQLASEKLDQIEVDETNEDYLEQTIDGVLYSQWVKNRAIEICKQAVAAKKLCEQEKVSTADYLEDAKELAEYYWNAGMYMYYEENGVSLETYKAFAAYDAYKSAYFDFLFGENGTQAVSTEEINKHLTEKYAYVNYITADISDMKTADAQQEEEKIKKYADRIYAGESFNKIYSEINETEFKEDSTDMGTFSNTQGSVWGDTDTAYETELFQYTKELKNGEVGVFKHKQDRTGNEYFVLILRGDILSEKNTNLETIKNSARTDLKGGDLDKLVKAEADKLSVKEVKYATNQFKVEKIYYPEGV